MIPTKDSAGKWIFDPSWPPAAQQQWAAARADIETETAKLATTEAARTATESSVESLLLDARIQADEARRARAAAEYALEDDAKWREAQAAHGGRVARLFVGIRWLVLKFNTALEWDKAVERSETVVAAALERGDDAAARRDRDAVFQDELLTKSLVHPSKGTARALLDAYPAAWPELYGLREQLNRGPREAAGKGGAR